MSEALCCNKNGKAAVGVKSGKKNAAPARKMCDSFWSGPGKESCKMTGSLKSVGCV